MTPNATVAAPEPARSPVVVVATPQVPVRSHTTPMTLVISVQSSQPVQMDTNASITSPCPAVSSMQVMIVVIPAPQMPVCTHTMPPGTIKPFQDAQAVQMSANASRTTPEPPWSLVVVIAPPQVPI